MHLRIAMLGCGNVGQALLRLLDAKADQLRERYDLTVSITGARTRTAGAWIAPDGISPADVTASGWPKGDAPSGSRPFEGDGVTFAATAPADMVLELSPLNPENGQPALDYVMAALNAGRHVVTANKGPLAFAYPQLRQLARERGVGLRFESTVIDGTPIFDMIEASLPVSEIRGFRGLLNGTTNFVLGRMARGESLEDAVAEAQRIGIAEADPSNDLDGWDASVKATVLANVLMGAQLRPSKVRREGLGAEAMKRAQDAVQPGQTLKQVVTAEREGDDVIARVRLLALPQDDLLAHVAGAAILLQTDTMGELTIVEGEGGPEQPAFGVLADIVNIARGNLTPFPIVG